MSGTQLYDAHDIAMMDVWAIRVVVREGRWLPLTKPELIVAAKLCKLKGFTATETAERLRITPDAAGKYWRIRPPVDMDQFGDDMIGQRVGPVHEYRMVAGLPRRVS